MASYSKSITIAAPVDRVYAFSQVPTNLPGLWPGMDEVSDVKELPNGGTRFQIHMHFAGIPMQVTSEDVEVKLNQCVVSKTGGMVESSMTWLYEPVDAGTRLTVNCEYTVPVPLLGKMAEGLIVKANEKDADAFLTNLKARLES